MNPPIHDARRTQAIDTAERLREDLIAKRTPVLSLRQEQVYRELHARGDKRAASELLQRVGHALQVEHGLIRLMGLNELRAYDAALDRGDRAGQVAALKSVVQRVTLDAADVRPNVRRLDAARHPAAARDSRGR